jgi:hypothetical protein
MVTMIRLTFSRRGLAAASLLCLLSACSDAPKPAAKKEPERPAEPLTGRQAFQKMYPSARGWALDAQPLQIQSYNLPEVKSSEGKAGAWQATFVSASQSKSRVYTWSAVEAEGNMHKGVFAGPEQGWSGPSGQNMAFDTVAIRVDSDEALKTAMEQKEIASFVKKNPAKPVTFIMEKTRRFQDVYWRVLWGESVGTSEYAVFVDATTGKFLEIVR